MRKCVAMAALLAYYSISDVGYVLICAVVDRQSALLGGLFYTRIPHWHDPCYTGFTLKGELMTPAEFKAKYPAFDSVSDDEIQNQIDLFGCLYQGDYGCSSDYLLGLFVAHQAYVSTAPGGGQVQTVGSRSVGDVSISYTASSGAAAAGDFASSKYGLEFSRLISLFGMGPIMAGAYCG